MPLTQPFVEQPADHLGVPVIEGCEKSEQDSAHDHIVEVSHDEVRVAELPVKGCRREHDSGQTRKEELEQKRKAEQHGRGIADFAPPHRTQPVEELDPGRNSDRHRGEDKEGITVRGHTNGKHVVSPDTHTYKPDAYRRRDHNRVAEYGLA